MEAFDHCENKCAFFKHFYRLKKRKGTSAYAIMQLLKLGGRFLIRQIFARGPNIFLAWLLTGLLCIIQFITYV